MVNLLKSGATSHPVQLRYSPQIGMSFSMHARAVADTGSSAKPNTFFDTLKVLLNKERFF